MSRRTSVLLVASWLAVPGLALAEEELTPEKLAAIRRDEKAAQARVDSAYGNRKSSEMSNEERQQSTREQQAAGLGVMEKHGVSDKEYSRRMARLTPEEREAVDQAEKKLEAEEKAKRVAEQKKRQGEDAEAVAADDIPIQMGISDENPVELEAAEGAGNVVEQGLPPGEQGTDEMPANESFEAATEAPAAPAPKAGGRRK
ncbi:hypothetical protein [Hyalangium minutum]|uniref:DUF4148 domain-containing protein n=1 Tax=Hyalangium minutum TaxID=394096 RepID=A0A085WFY7_9BACT|nr:hypothetical protein [Hyalangium minutum]KFE66600.1 hypothetical protein DB31_1073 [Hyalangium minutum]